MSVVLPRLKVNICFYSLVMCDVAERERASPADCHVEE